MSSEDHKIYFDKFISFLYEYNFVFKEANTELLTENILLKMYEKFEIQPTEKLKYDNNKIVDCENQNLLDLQKKIDYFKTNHSICMSSGNLDGEVISSRYSGSKSVPLGPKKRHEIIRMSRVVHDLCLEKDCNMIVDLGSGLGYLSQHLHTVYGYNVLGIESDEQRLKSAIKRQEKYHKTSIGKVKYHSHTITSNSNIYLQDLITKEFPNYEKVCLIGLHACADLTIDGMKLFLEMEHAVGLVVMPCCYHKLSLADFSHNFNRIIEENNEETSQLIQNDSIKDSKIETTTSNDSTISGNNILDSIHPTETSSKHYVHKSHTNIHKISTNDKSEKNPQVTDGKDSEMTADDSARFIENEICICTSGTSSQHYIPDVITNIHPNIDFENENLKRTKTDYLICQHFNYFPLSNALQVVMNNYKGCTFLKRPFLRLCCQPPSVDQPMDLLVFRLMSRAVLQLYAVRINASLVKKKRRAVKRTETTLCDFDAFLTEAITNGYTLHSNAETSNLTEELSNVTGGISDLTVMSKLTKESLNAVETSEVTTGENSHSLEASRESKSDKFIEFNRDAIQDIWRETEKYSDMAAIYILLQRFFQPICENLLLHDRIIYLRENGCLNCKFVRITDQTISPKCMALVASK